ncbi:MAG: class I SAM-dependent RNA methyltransferase [Aquabacterium sp.]|uniref:THUMP domain-containing class I SAM-dependent RNA methyltransferase n=1 Tax=Aquabacterium sp. TaxID=1872578 RepID=UPI0025B88D86|nr:THUMP domain-containing protein [Aquabacterium sp.]MBI3384405.1 class I SAM-dependent RNA methyltransferase [Aquabacterium sp.]
MPIKPPRRPVVSSATGRPSGSRESGDPRSARSGRPAGPSGPAGQSADRPRATAPVLAADRPAALYLSCAAGVEPLLAAEVGRIVDNRALVNESRGGIEVLPSPQLRTPQERLAALADFAMRLNLESRLAQRVLWRVASRVYRHEDDIYHLGRTVNWSEWITPRNTIRVDVTSRRSHLQSLNFAALRVKDAVCDDMRDRFGERPDVDTRFPDLSLVLYMDDMEAVLYVDTSGEALFKRGWREDTGEAPLKETLAAAMLAAADWQGRPEDGALLDPCCGAGTIPIEAAQIACGIAPGLQRRFAFEKLLPFRPHLAAWQAIKQAARDRQHPPRVAIYAGDVAFRMTDFATRNAERAGVRQYIEFKTADALQRPVPCERGVLMFNPPYGERIDTKGSARNAYRARSESEDGEPYEPQVRAGREQFQDEEAATFFQRLSSHWKKQYTGWTAWILSPDMKLPGAMRLKESRRVVMFNGPIECRLFRFDLVAGGNRRAPAAGADAPTSPAPSDES